MDRREVAQRFLDTFARQNDADLNSIVSVEGLSVVNLDGTQAALYQETLQKFIAYDFKLDQFPTSEKSSNDEDAHIQTLVSTSATAEEVLLRQAAEIIPSLATNGLRAVINRRLTEPSLRMPALLWAVREAEGLMKLIDTQNLTTEKYQRWCGEEQHDGKANKIFQALIKRARKDPILFTEDSSRAWKGAILAPNAAALALEAKADAFDSADEDGSHEGDNIHFKAVDDIKAFNALEKADSSHQQVEQLKYLIYNILRPQGREFDNMIRSLRYLANIEQLQLLFSQSDPAKQLVRCSKHRSVERGQSRRLDKPEEVCPGVSDYGKLRIISLCGHVACLDCLKGRRLRDTCVVESCKGTVSDSFLQEIDRFGISDSLGYSLSFTGFDCVEEEIVSPIDVAIGNHPSMRHSVQKAILGGKLTYEDIKEYRTSLIEKKDRSAAKALTKTNIREKTPHEDANPEDAAPSLITKYGAKLDDVVQILKTNSTDKAILFVQMDSMMPLVKNCFENSKIEARCILNNEKAGFQNQSHKIAEFKDPTGTVQVLVLDLNSEHAAGLNLTEANHIIFFSPLLITNQQRYEATMLQAIRRAHRFGQTKIVHIYRFVALNTIDVDILQHRERWLSKPLVEHKVADKAQKAQGGKDKDQTEAEVSPGAVVKRSKPQRAKLVRQNDQYKLAALDFVIAEGLELQRDHGSLIDLNSRQPEEFFFDD